MNKQNRGMKNLKQIWKINGQHIYRKTMERINEKENIRYNRNDNNKHCNNSI